MVKEINGLKKGQKTTEIAIYLEGSLVLAKIIIALLSGSLVLISDAIHSASDILSILSSWFGLKIAQKKADKLFPYGYFKAENIGALIISIFIIFASWEMFSRGLDRLSLHSVIKIPLLAIAISLLDAIILFFFGNFEIKIGRQYNIQSLIAMGKENKTHLFSSTAVAAGIIAAYLKIPYIEGFITIIISLLILRIGFNTAKDSIFSLMDVSPGKKIEQKVIKVVESVSGIEDVFDLRLRKSGPYILGEIKVGVRKSIDLKKAHTIADRIEEKVQKKIPQIESLTVHVEPYKSNWLHIVIPIDQNKGLNSCIAARLARAPNFLFINIKNKKIRGFYIIKNPYLEKKVKTGLAIAKLVAGQKSDILLTKEIGEIAFYTLKENLFDIYQTKDKLVKSALKNYLAGKLRPIRKATKSV